MFTFSTLSPITLPNESKICAAVCNCPFLTAFSYNLILIPCKRANIVSLSFSQSSSFQTCQHCFPFLLPILIIPRFHSFPIPPRRINPNILPLGVINNKLPSRQTLQLPPIQLLSPRLNHNIRIPSPINLPSQWSVRTINIWSINRFSHGQKLVLLKK